MRNITLTPLSHWFYGFLRVRENWSLSQIKIYVVYLAFFFQTIIKISLYKEAEAEGQLTGIMSHSFENTCAPKHCPLSSHYKNVQIFLFGVLWSPHTCNRPSPYHPFPSHYSLSSKHHHGSRRQGRGLQLDLQDGDERSILKVWRSWRGCWTYARGAQWIIWCYGQMNRTMISPVYHVCCVYCTTVWYI